MKMGSRYLAWISVHQDFWNMDFSTRIWTIVTHVRAVGDGRGIFTDVSYWSATWAWFKSEE